ncbi:restriction endonuclease subunit S [Variovorax sp. KK3]|uniref:restriction endonuclease subunit S n=1 Tax=Variovorax sp. KK3 TaxID=1855728 RepID=UPI00097C2681|nr:restriction endonuclease subunit S [Variovorax sp. KK3]
MSVANFLEKLLNGVAAECFELGKLITPKRGKRLVKSQLEEVGSYAVYQNSTKPLGYYHESNAPAGSTFIVVAGAAGDIDFSKAAFWAADDVYFFPGSNSLNSKYLYHFLQTKQHEISSQVRRASIPRLSIAAVEKLKIPIPCPDNPEKSLGIQAEIVRILDAFTELTGELTAELNAELNARKKQYDHYRDWLLSFPHGGVAWRQLGEIGEFIRGKRFTKADFVDDGIDVIHYGEIYTRYGAWTDRAFSKVRLDMEKSLRYALTGDVIMTGVGETVEDVGKAVAWIGKNSVAIHDDSYAFRHAMNPKFIAYAMQTNAFIDQKAKRVSRGKVKRLLVDGISRVEIPVPFPDNPEQSLTEQARIVAILDKFDTVTNSVTEGLLHELELRQEQYEYYRKLLFSFPNAKETEA